MRNTIVKFFAATLAVASLSVFATPTYAAAAEDSPAQAQAGWCDVVPPFCGGCQANARCRPTPCQVKVSADRGVRNDQGICAVKED